MTLGENFPTVLAAARTGADWAWSEIYRDLAPPVLSYLRVRGAPEPEDVLGEVFLQVVKNLKTFEGGERHFRAWVLTIAHRRLVDAVRLKARRPAPSPLNEEDATGPWRDAEEEGLAGAEAAACLDVMRGLSPDQQDVLFLRLLGELTIEEVARATGKSLGAVKALQRRGLTALKKELSRQGVTL